MSRISYLGVFLLVHGVLVMDGIPDSTGIRGHYIQRLCGFDEITPAANTHISTIIERLLDETDAEAVSAAAALIYALSAEEEELSARIAQELIDAALAKTAQEEEDARGARLHYGGLQIVAPHLRRVTFKRGLDVTPLIGELLQEFSAICRKEGHTFDVHKLDGLTVRHWGTMLQYFDAYSPATAEIKSLFGENLTNVSVIRNDFQEIMSRMSPALLAEFDLTPDYLERAFTILQQGEHATLVPTAVKLYTLLKEYCPTWLEQYIITLLSNVNRFKGAECFEGYRNRFFAIWMQFVRDYGTGTGQIYLED
ncbi:MAG: hypothetical protein LBF54_01760 [Holosporaceae bacterium]|jgi:hypothetical protein|nr:hypothetical protein [Holosporaceae bacterium]